MPQLASYRLTHLWPNVSEWFYTYSHVNSVLCEHVQHLFSPGFFFFLKIVFECAVNIVASGQMCCMHPFNVNFE